MTQGVAIAYMKAHIIGGSIIAMGTDTGMVAMMKRFVIEIVP
eukprot:CAMPEP_0178933466 /NCGR_PEP_ID=MMETSP0786-20121207/23279_1 /TAXON_ID=186022 /ORGANISM="Thalassionema frauenfeldii, Strain CCMP 1798" /LENGTH=41 /DNA_ID= /DNA_START= /DNA_END= /DNA_ORIENTATION=